MDSYPWTSEIDRKRKGDRSEEENGDSRERKWSEEEVRRKNKWMRDNSEEGDGDGNYIFT